MSISPALCLLVGWLATLASAAILWGPATSVFVGGIGIVAAFFVDRICLKLDEISKILEQANSSKTKDLQQ